MFKFLKKTYKKAGLPPGTLVHVGEKKTDYIRIRIMDYNDDQLYEREVNSIEECFEYKDTANVTWVNIDGLHDLDIIKRTGDHYGFHPLVLEDIVHTDQRPKIEEYDKYIFLIFKMLSYNDEQDSVDYEQFSLVLGENYVISFQEKFGDVFSAVRERLRKKSGRIRQRKADYLMYALMDAVVDNYFNVLDRLSARIESCEDELAESPDEKSLYKIHQLKKELTFIRRSVWPLREMIGNINKLESEIIQDSTYIYLRDVHDHTVRIIDIIETFREMVSNLTDTYNSNVSNRMNEIMKVLTIIATLFIPLTFLAGIYGMNFKFMPELEWKWGYPSILVLMAVVIVLMFIWFRRKKFW